MNIATIHNEVIEKLKADGTSVKNRRKTIAKLAKSLAKPKSPLLPMLRHRKAWFSTTQTVTIAADGGARVQTLGIEVGEVSLNRSTSEPFYEFKPTEKHRKELEFPEGPWKWSHHQKDGYTIRDYLSKCRDIDRANAENEREIQWQLADALRSTRHAALRHLQPVTWNSCFTELGVAVNLKGESGTGNIDLAVRRGKGGQRGFLMFELKKPGENEVEIALQQALRYATALNWEANTESEDNRRNYHSVLGSGARNFLKIGAVVVLEDDDRGIVRRNAPDILKNYWAERGDSQIDRLGVLLYKFDREHNKVTSWKWLDWWDARNKPL